MIPEKTEPWITFTGDVYEALRDIVWQWINEGFTTPPYADVEYEIFEALGLAAPRGLGHQYDTRRPA